MIAMHEQNAVKYLISQSIEKSIYDQTRDNNIIKAFMDPPPPTKLDMDLSSPIKICNYAKAKLFKHSQLYKHEDTNNLKLLTKDPVLQTKLRKLISDYVDKVGAVEMKTTMQLKSLLDQGPLQIFVYVNNRINEMHTLLLRKDTGNYYIYDTAYGSDFRVTKVEDVLTFNRPFNTMKGGSKERENAFLGIVVHLKL